MNYYVLFVWLYLFLLYCIWYCKDEIFSSWTSSNDLKIDWVDFCFSLSTWYIVCFHHKAVTATDKVTSLWLFYQRPRVQKQKTPIQILILSQSEWDGNTLTEWYTEILIVCLLLLRKDINENLPFYCLENYEVNKIVKELRKNSSQWINFLHSLIVLFVCFLLVTFLLSICKVC